MTWTLVIFITLGGPSIVIHGFRTLDDCKFAGEIYKAHINPNPKVQYRCTQPA